MPVDPDRRNLLPSIQSRLRSIRGMPKDELALLLRIGNLIDATIQAARGLANVGDGTRRSFDQRVPIPGNLELFNALDGIDINFDPVDFDNLAHYEVQVDINANFSDPLTATSQSNKFMVRGLDPGTYSVRVRSVDRIGRVSDWTDAETITIGATVFDADGDYLWPEDEQDEDIAQVLSKTFVNTGSGDIAFMGIGGSFEFDGGTSSHRLDFPLQSAVTFKQEENDVEEFIDYGLGAEQFNFFPEFYFYTGAYARDPFCNVDNTSNYTFCHFLPIDFAANTGDVTWDVKFQGTITGVARDIWSMKARHLVYSIIKF